MSLRFILGSASYDHDAKLIDQLASDYHRRPHDYYFYLVPNHVKFKSEIAVLDRLNRNRLPVYAQMNVQIFSLTRMSWYFLGQKPFPQVPELDSSGVNMLIYQIIKRHQSNLVLFKGEVDKPGFILKLASEISEMQLGGISASDLARIAKEETGWNHDLVQKTRDFITVYSAFEKLTRGQYISKSGALARLCEALKDFDLSHFHFYVSGFSKLTAQEIRVVRILIQRSASVLVDLVLDRPYANQWPSRPNLFYNSARLYHSLYQFARQSKVPVLPDLSAKNLRVSLDLHRLDRFWVEAHRLGPIHPSSLSDPGSIQIVRCDSNYAELSWVATKIRQMVTLGNYRYSDFLILTRHLDKFENVIEPIFHLQGIHIFNDLQRQMAAHPLVQLIDALFKVFDPNHPQSSYRYPDVMNLLKTELLIPRGSDGHLMNIADYRDDLAICENLVLAKGYRGASWLQGQDWRVTKYDDISHQLIVNREASKRANVIRHFVKETLPPFYKKLSHAHTNREAATILYTFLVNHGVVTRLKQWRAHTQSPTNASRPSQVWAVFCRILDNFVMILGADSFKSADFISFLDAGFAGTSYSQLPPAFDQVVISESKIVQTNDYKVVFMIGSTDDTMPDQITNGSLFGDADRDAMGPLIKHDFGDNKYLNDNSESQMAGEPSLNYLAFMSATQKVIFTYNLGRRDENNGNVRISPYVKQIRDHFQLPIKHVPDQPNLDSELVKPYVGSEKGTLHHLIQVAHQAKRDHRALPKVWQFIKAQLLNSPHARVRHLTKRLLASVNYDNVPSPLTREVAAELYGPNITTSVSQLESFYDDPYEYFLRYGLRLKKRDVLSPSPERTGLFYHEALDHLIRFLQNHHYDIIKLGPKQLGSIVDNVVGQILSDPKQTQYDILGRSHRMSYLKDQLIRTVKEMAVTLHFQSRLTPMRPDRTEIPFGKSHRDLLPLDFKLRTRPVHHLLVRGRIDRIDRMTVRHRQYFGIVDYKSSQHQFKFGRILAGNQLQLLIYLDVLRKNLNRLSGSEKSRLSGTLYSWVHFPTLKFKANAKTSDDELRLARLKDQKYSGILVDDPEILSTIDCHLKPGHSALLYKLHRKKSGGISKRSRDQTLVSEKGLNQMLNWVERLIIHAGDKIYSGYDAIHPVRFARQKTLLEYSPFLPIMQFDPLLPHNEYREVDPISGLADLVKQIQKKEANQK